MQPTHNSKAPGYNPWKLYKVMSWFLKPLLFKRNLQRYSAVGALPFEAAGALTGVAGAVTVGLYKLLECS
jgi:hypothetical protein